jgi:hypothetical protein
MTVNSGSPRRKFGPNCRAESESIADFVTRSELTAEDIAWTQGQQVHGRPSLPRLRATLAEAGFADIELRLSADRQDLSFQVRVTDQVAARDSDSLLRLWITALRAAGFNVGIGEVGITAAEGDLVYGQALTGPLAEIAEHGAPQIDPEGTSGS